MLTFSTPVDRLLDAKFEQAIEMVDQAANIFKMNKKWDRYVKFVVLVPKVVRALLFVAGLLFPCSAAALRICIYPAALMHGPVVLCIAAFQLCKHLEYLCVPPPPPPTSFLPPSAVYPEPSWTAQTGWT